MSVTKYIIFPTYTASIAPSLWSNLTIYSYQRYTCRYYARDLVHCPLEIIATSSDGSV